MIFLDVKQKRKWEMSRLVIFLSWYWLVVFLFSFLPMPTQRFPVSQFEATWRVAFLMCPPPPSLYLPWWCVGCNGGGDETKHILSIPQGIISRRRRVALNTIEIRLYVVLDKLLIKFYPLIVCSILILILQFFPPKLRYYDNTFNKS